MFTLDEILQVTIGLTGCGIAAALVFKLLIVMTRYNVLLTGQSLDEIEDDEKGNSANVQCLPDFHYRLRIQSLEPTRTEYPLQVTIRGFPDGACRHSSDHHVWVAAGWKSINVIHRFATPEANKAGDSDQSKALEPFLWQAVFPELPALETWSFDVVMPCQRLELSIGFVGVEEPRLLTPTFGPYFEPDRLIVYSTDRGEPRIRGPITLPRPVVPLILSCLTLLAYVLYRALTHWRIDLSLLTRLDGVLLGAALALIWLGYSAIRRPVYPVISGYRFITPPWPEKDDGQLSSPVDRGAEPVAAKVDAPK